MTIQQQSVQVQLEELRKRIINCRRCPRLVRFREQVARVKKREFKDFDYWGKPVPGFGDSTANLVVVGLAPAAHGGNRTGRVFTGDASARFLTRHLYRAGFANQPTSTDRDDGLTYRNCYLSAVVRCVPPDNKPTSAEIKRCSDYFSEEMLLLSSSRVILALGKIAFDAIIRFAKETRNLKGSYKFEHAKRYILFASFPVLYASYHPSPRNTNTGKLTDQMFSHLLQRIRSEIENH